MSRHQVYLDNAAATPVVDEVYQAMQPFFTDSFYNASAIYLKSKDVRAAIDKSRTEIARLMGAKPAEIIFTSGATEADNLAVLGVHSKFPDGEVLISTIEHPAVEVPAGKCQTRTIKVSNRGLVEVDDLKRNISSKTVLVSIMLANNEVGTVQPIKKIAEFIREERVRRRKNGEKIPIYLHSDAAQAANYLKIDVNRLGLDLMTVSSAKIYGPKGIGCLYANKDVQMDPQILGGGHEFGVRSGTENTAGIVGFAKAFQLAQTNFKSEALRLDQLNSLFREMLENKFGDKIVFNGNRKDALPNFINVSFLGVDGERLVMELDEAGIMAATGAACSATDSKGSKTLLAMGLTEDYVASSVRFSMGRHTAKEDIDYVLKTLESII